MAKDLTISAVERQNILNNPYAIAEIEKAVGIRGIPFDGRVVVLKENVSAFFGITTRTVDNYLERYGPELARNGYELLRGNRLKLFKEALSTLDANETNFVSIGKASQLGIFDFRAFLNLAMLLAESEQARLLRQAILDIVIDTINKRTGGGTKYINQRDEDFIQSLFSGEDYRKQFTDALMNYVDMGNFKYPLFTDRIYLTIFKEKSKEYRKILSLQKSDRTRDTFYSEVIDLISSFECGFADMLRRQAKAKDRKLTSWEADSVFKELQQQAHWVPLIDKARIKMASRDLAFRDALHLQIAEYVTPVQREDFERFLGEKSKELAERLEDAKDVLKRLKDR